MIEPGWSGEWLMRYMQLATGIDSTKLVALYIRFYPLFQQAYEDLGYPKAYFNDRVVEVIDHLLAAPEVPAQTKLVQPKVFYQFADPDLETRSAGQKILMRIGNERRRPDQGEAARNSQ
jgi:Protein of unknown function (DUF3014)